MYSNEPSTNGPTSDDDSTLPNLYNAIGRAISQWAHIEHALAFGFGSTLRTSERAAKAVFFSARAFSGKRDMLMAAIQETADSHHGIDKLRQAILKAACNKATKWYPVRNQLVHEIPCLFSSVGTDLTYVAIVPNVLKPDLVDSMDRMLSVTAVREATNNFSGLVRIIRESFSENEAASLEKLREQCHALPARPYLDSIGNPHAIAEWKRQHAKPHQG